MRSDPHEQRQGSTLHGACQAFLNAPRQLQPQFSKHKTDLRNWTQKIVYRSVREVDLKFVSQPSCARIIRGKTKCLVKVKFPVASYIVNTHSAVRTRRFANLVRPTVSVAKAIYHICQR
jgi:hypothetical protein